MNKCTRSIPLLMENTLLLRDMNWFQPLEISLWVFLPRGLYHNGGIEKNLLTWTSQYGSLALTTYNKSKVEGNGLNEKGLLVNRFLIFNI